MFEQYFQINLENYLIIVFIINFHNLFIIHLLNYHFFNLLNKSSLFFHSKNQFTCLSISI